MANNRSDTKRIKKSADINDATLLATVVLIIAICILLVMTSVYGIIAAILNPQALLSGFEFPFSGNGAPSGDSYPFKQEININISPDTENAFGISSDEINSEFATLVKLDGNSGEIIASKKSSSLIYPASMTKIMTLIVVYENLKSEDALNDLLEIKIDRGEHSGYGFEIGEKLTVKDLIYAAILQSDGVACITLAEYIAGSEANFVKLMNEKVEELGLLEGDPATNPSTNFTNCSGLHEQYHYTTPYDMAVITAYAMKNTFCANVLTSLSYKPSENFRPGEGCTFWHGLLHNRLNDGAIQPTTATIKGGKTGWAGKETGYCIATVANGKDGATYVLITANAEGWGEAVDDSKYIYNTFIDVE